MANPLPNEDKLYERFKNEHITISPLIWELIDHHIRNDLNLISVGIGNLRLHPTWILKCASLVIKFLYRLSFQPGKPEDLIEVCDKGLDRVQQINKFLIKRLKQSTLPE